MLEKTPSNEDLGKLVGDKRLAAWNTLCSTIDEQYDMDKLWNKGGKDWPYEYKYRRGGKTLCALYAKENCTAILIILGKAEREKFEAAINDYSATVQKIYNETKTYHDGKWMLFEFEDESFFDDFMRMLAIKRKPNRK